MKVLEELNLSQLLPDGKRAAAGRTENATKITVMKWKKFCMRIGVAILASLVSTLTLAGPEVVGVKIGMSVAEAQARALKSQPGMRFNPPDQVRSPIPNEALSIRLDGVYKAPDLSYQEQLHIYLAGAPEPNAVLAVVRNGAFSVGKQPTLDSFEAKLVETYGSPSEREPPPFNRFIWFFDASGKVVAPDAKRNVRNCTGGRLPMITDLAAPYQAFKPECGMMIQVTVRESFSGKGLAMGFDTQLTNGANEMAARKIFEDHMKARIDAGNADAREKAEKVPLPNL